MLQWPALILAVLGGVALAIGAVIEHGQRSNSGPIGVVPTLPHAFGAAMLVGMAIALLRIARNPVVTWWHVPLGFVLVLGLGVWLIVTVGSRAERNRKQ
jgi:hypothetical protein